MAKGKTEIVDGINAADWIKVADFKIERWSWIIQVGPVQSHFKGEEGGRRESDRW